MAGCPCDAGNREGCPYHRLFGKPTDADGEWQEWVGEVYQLAGAVLLAGDHYTPESLESLQTLLLDALATPMTYSAYALHEEWKRRSVLSPMAVADPPHLVREGRND